MLRNTLRFFQSKVSQNVFCSTSTQELTSVVPPSPPPMIVNLNMGLEDLRITSEEPREAWIENLTSAKEEKLGLVSLHPDIFGRVPRLDIIHENVVWQMKYKDINFEHAKIPVEMRGPGKGYGRKPWPQKGTGRARHGSTRGPQWHKGGTVHGPRKFTTKFFMLPYNKRVMGLISTLSCKLAQDDLKIVPDLDLPSDEGNFLEDLVEERSWGPSVLFVDVDDVMPRNITLATDNILHYNLLPVYGLNVHSMLKHDTLVLTLSAVERIQEKLLLGIHNPVAAMKTKRYIH